MPHHVFLVDDANNPLYSQVEGACWAQIQREAITPKYYSRDRRRRENHGTVYGDAYHALKNATSMHGSFDHGDAHVECLHYMSHKTVGLLNNMLAPLGTRVWTEDEYGIYHEYAEYSDNSFHFSVDLKSKRMTVDRMLTLLYFIRQLPEVGLVYNKFPHIEEKHSKTFKDLVIVTMLSQCGRFQSDRAVHYYPPDFRRVYRKLLGNMPTHTYYNGIHCSLHHSRIVIDEIDVVSSTIARYNRSLAEHGCSLYYHENKNLADKYLEAIYTGTLPKTYDSSKPIWYNW